MVERGWEVQRSDKFLNAEQALFNFTTSLQVLWSTSSSHPGPVWQSVSWLSWKACPLSSTPSVSTGLSSTPSSIRARASSSFLSILKAFWQRLRPTTRRSSKRQHNREKRKTRFNSLNFISGTNGFFALVFSMALPHSENEMPYPYTYVFCLFFY